MSEIELILSAIFHAFLAPVSRNADEMIITTPISKTAIVENSVMESGMKSCNK